jgi:hypothetical protein
MNTTTIIPPTYSYFIAIVMTALTLTLVITPCFFIIKFLYSVLGNMTNYLNLQNELMKEKIVYYKNRNTIK